MTPNLFKQRQYVPLTATRKCPLQLCFILMRVIGEFSDRLVRNRSNELPGCLERDDRLVPHRVISPRRSQIDLAMTPAPRTWGGAEASRPIDQKKPHGPIMFKRPNRISEFRRRMFGNNWILVVDLPRPLQQLPHFDLGLGVGSLPGTGRISITNPPRRTVLSLPTVE